MVYLKTCAEFSAICGILVMYICFEYFFFQLYYIVVVLKCYFQELQRKLEVCNIWKIGRVLLFPSWRSLTHKYLTFMHGMNILNGGPAFFFFFFLKCGQTV